MAFVSAAISVALIGFSAADEKKYDAGASDAAIKVGNIMPYSDRLLRTAPLGGR